ncbi:Ger(x)C family spore germination protein [Paenibacillus oenotherae]|uniref:Ger(X)C family spore germination protein n=1 Tax=Paenibacillus oenotherae TaxID=1435645 RepID=A0ABS7DAV5_9BACL|nr:Ger(x)C family spore germination protein [Paenibacillus oenotherae]MBW7477011.1 Ger(x)C family spore germination protein [Paenibacillus oenotherae]
MKHKPSIVALILALLAAALSGCGFKDIDKRFFVVAIGIDRPADNPKNYLVTLKLAVPSPKIEPGAAKAQIESVEAPTIAEAVRLIKSYVDKELDFGHCKIYMLGDSLAQQGYTDAINWVSRRRDIQNVAYLAIGKPDARTIIQSNPPAERYPGNTLFLQFGKDGTESSYIISTYIFDFVRRVGEHGLDPVLPIMRKEKEEYIITRVALLDKEKAVAALTPSETEIFNQISHHMTKSTVTANVNGEIMVLSVNKITSRYKIVKEADGSHMLRMTIKISGIFEEAPMGVYSADWAKLEAAFNKQYEFEANSLLKKIQQAGVDPLGFGLRYRATHKGSEQTWKRWQTIYPQLKFDVTAKITIEGTGISD